MIPELLLGVAIGVVICGFGVALGFMAGRRHRSIAEEAEGWLELSSQQGASTYAPPRAPVDPIDPALIDAKMAAMRAEISDLAKAPIAPLFVGDPVTLVDDPPGDPIEGTVLRIRPAPPEVLVIWGNDEDPRWHNLYELKAAGS